MCHESTSVALDEAIGIGKGSVSLEDIHRAELIVIAGQNPGTNHPRMLTALEKAKQNGAKIIAINPLREAGLVRFKNPQKVRGLVGHGTGLADLFLPVRVNGDLALFQAIGALLLEWGCVDKEFVARVHHRVRRVGRARARPRLGRGPPRDRPGALADRGGGGDVPPTPRRPSPAGRWGSPSTATPSRRSRRSSTSPCSRATSASPVPGLCPVRGHSNVQGDRTMGIWEKPPEHFLDSLRDTFGFEPPREHGYDTVAAIQALRDGKAHFFMGMGGNFVSAAPDTEVTEAALRNAQLTVHVSTKLNRSHVVHRHRGADPAGARPLREGPDRRPATSGSPSRTPCPRCTRRAGRSSRPRRT